MMEIDGLKNFAQTTAQLRVIPKSGRWWKKQQKHRHTAIFQVKSLKSNKAKNLKERLQKQMVKAKEVEIRKALTTEKENRRQQQKEREERRKANERKGEVVQVIRNTKKLMNTKNKKKKLRNIETRDTN